MNQGALSGAPRAHRDGHVLCRTSRKPVGSWGCVSAIDSNGGTIWIVDAHCDDGKRFVGRAEEKLTAFVELESAIRVATGGGCHTAWSDDTCPKSLVEEIMYLRNQP
jgi:hypothetical protein